MTKLHVACGQFEANPGNAQANSDLMKSQIAEASRRGCSLIVFPEMALTGYLPPIELSELAIPVSHESVQAIANRAAAESIAVAFGFPEKDAESDRLYNTMIVFDESGRQLFRYHKIHLWDTEAKWAEAGTEVPVAEWRNSRLTGWICYDTRFPELARLSFLKGAEVALVPTAWLGPAEEWDIAVRSRAMDNTMFVLGSDLINSVPGLLCRGLSLISGPHGEVLARANPGETCIIDAVLEPETMAAQRARVPLLRDRVPSLYRPLAGS